MSNRKKFQNKLLLIFSTILSLGALIIFFLHKQFHFSQQQVLLENGEINSHTTPIIVLLCLLLILNIASWSSYIKINQTQKYRG